MARLRTFGAVELSDSAGRQVDAILSRQRRVALLVYLAVEARNGFVRRESLFGVFWPELDQSRARAALRQSLYVLRSELGEEMVVTRGAEEVGVGAALQCDAVLFEEHMAAARFADALALYRGAFLNGFFIPDAPGFERWVDERRDSLRRSAARAATQLALASRAQHDFAAAARHLRDALELEPTDESTLRSLMMTLEDGGDRAAALREFAQYAELLAREYELVPSPETGALADAIRAGERAVERPVSFEPRRVSPDDPGLGLSRGPRPRLSGARWLAAATIGLAAMGLAGVWAATRASGSDRDEPRLIVLPFEVRAGSDLSYLGEGMSDLLSTSLDGPELFRAVPPTIVLRDLRERADSGAQAARKTAERFGAEHYVLGSVVSADGKVRFDARMFSQADGTAPIARASVEGSPDSIFSLVDDLSTRLIADSRGRGPARRLQSSAALTTRSLTALKDYLAGERALRDGAFGPAIEFFRKATTTDSTFALAYYRMSMAAEWNSDPALGLRMAAIAHRHSQRLSAKDAALLRAHYDMLRGAVDDAERQYRVILADSPDELEAWLKVGEIVFHNNPARGRPIDEAAEPFERVLSYDRTHMAALLHLARLAAAQGQLEKLDMLASRYLALRVADGSLGIRLLAAAARRDSALVHRLARLLAAEPDEAVTAAARDVFMFARNPAAAVEVLRANIAPGRGAERNALTHLQIAAVELARGRRAAAAAGFEQAARLGQPQAAAYLQALYTVALGAEESRAELAGLRTRLTAVTSSGPVAPRLPLLALLHHGSPAIRAALLAEVSMALGDTAAARRHVDEIATAPTAPNHEWMRDPLLRATRARMALAEGRADEALEDLRRFRHPDNVPLNRGFAWYGLLRLREGDALAALGRGREAIPLWTSFEHQSLFLTPFLAPGYARAARQLASQGDPAAAAMDERARSLTDKEPRR